MVKELLKRFFKSRLGAWTVAAVAAVILVQGKRISDEGSYAHMQEQTVLLRLPDGQGSGVVVERDNEDGKTRVFVWTANHVVEGHTDVAVVKAIRTEGHRAGEATFTAKVIGRDKARDLALLWVDAPAGFFRAAEFAPSDPINVGTPLVLAGNVLGGRFEDSLSLGIMSGIGYTPSHWKLTDQAALAGFFGCSGGPIFRQGERDVAGITVGMVPGSGFMQFVPVRVIEEFANESVLHWAVRGDWCPGDGLLQGLATREIQIKSFSVN